MTGRVREPKRESTAELAENQGSGSGSESIWIHIEMASLDTDPDLGQSK